MVQDLAWHKVHIPAGEHSTLHDTPALSSCPLAGTVFIVPAARTLHDRTADKDGPLRPSRHSFLVSSPKSCIHLPDIQKRSARPDPTRQNAAQRTGRTGKVQPEYIGRVSSSHHLLFTPTPVRNHREEISVICPRCESLLGAGRVDRYPKTGLIEAP